MSLKLERAIDLRGAISINVITMIGIGPLVTIPLVIAALGGPLALVGWVAGAIVALCDGLVWAELSSRYPGSGGTYVYLRNVFGAERLGKALAFLFNWQFLLAARACWRAAISALQTTPLIFYPALASHSSAPRRGRRRHRHRDAAVALPANYGRRVAGSGCWRSLQRSRLRSSRWPGSHTQTSRKPFISLAPLRFRSRLLGGIRQRALHHALRLRGLRRRRARRRRGACGRSGRYRSRSCSPC